jgi:hypothetical protein
LRRLRRNRVALANKTARIVWAVLTRHQSYMAPAM